MLVQRNRNPKPTFPTPLPPCPPVVLQPVDDEDDDGDADMADAGRPGSDQAHRTGPRSPRRVLKQLTPAQAALRRQELGTKVLDPEFLRRYVLYVRRHR